MGAQLGVILTINTAAVRAGQNSIKALATQNVGHVTVGDSGGVGTVTHALVEKPDWDTRDDRVILTHNEGTWSLAPRIPPVPAIKSKYVIEATDSATPTPATARAELAVEQLVPVGWTLLPQWDAVGVLVQDSIWQQLYHVEVDLPAKSGESDRRTVWHLRRNVNDHRLLVAIEDSAVGSTGTRYNDHRVVIYDGNVRKRAFCESISRWMNCTEAEAHAAWNALIEHLPPYRP